MYACEMRIESCTTFGQVFPPARNIMIYFGLFDGKIYSIFNFKPRFSKTC